MTASQVNICTELEVEKKLTVGLSSHSFGQLTTFFETDIPGGGSNQARDSVSIMILTDN